jgi:hypothetical protein
VCELFYCNNQPLLAYDGSCGTYSVSNFLCHKDTCERPMPLYNDKYNPFEPARDDLPSDYSPYVNGEPLFNDKAVIVTNLPKGMILSPATKKLNRSWLWLLGYTLIYSAANKKGTFWACKLCMLFVLYVSLMLIFLGHHDL